MRAATATPSGAANNTAAPIHSITELVPALAATEIHRGPTMQAMANRVRSLRPSSRFRWVMPCETGRWESTGIMALGPAVYSNQWRAVRLFSPLGRLYERSQEIGAMT